MYHPRTRELSPPPPVPADPLITRVEPLRPRGLRVLLHLDDGEPLEVTLEALELCRLGVGDRLPQATRRGLLDADADVRVREAALHLLTSRARTRQELRRKLRGKGFATSRVDSCLDRLEEKGLLDDAAVASAFVRDRLRHRPRGRSRLTSELRAKGVDVDVAEDAIARVFEDEEVSDARLARESAEAWLRRQGPAIVGSLAAQPGPARDKATRRLYGYFARRGFGGEAVTDAIEHARRLAAEPPDSQLS
jgi:SOS response regulatory protein OraA/RecX